MIARLWKWFWRPATKYAWGGIFIAGGLAGIIFWGGFNTFMEYSNTLEFCISCHEMEQTPYQEYRKTTHFKNRTGVSAVCSDCHVPREWTAKFVRKIRATNELFHKVVGTVDTPQKFEANRLAMAERVWAAMEATDSRECRNCHAFTAMDLSKQDRRPREKHPEAIEQGKTCIDCHKGIAHKLPADYERDD